MRVVQKWQDKLPIETVILKRGQNLDLKRMNEDTPKREWVKGPDGKLCGPWQRQYLVYLLNPKTMTRYTFVTGSLGGGVAVRELEQAIDDRQKWAQKSLRPIVTLSDAHWPTQFGDRRRPEFLIVDWRDFGGVEEQAPTLLPPPDSVKENVEEKEEWVWEDDGPEEEEEKEEESTPRVRRIPKCG
jgi:hypothetical protein